MSITGNASALWEVVLPQKDGNFTDLDLDKVRVLYEGKKGGTGQLTNQSGTSVMNTTTLDTPKPKKASLKYRKNLEMLNSHAAGLDLHKEKIWVCPGGFADNREPEVKTFGTMTGEIYKLITYLKSKKITTVAMEATGIYWVPVFDLLRDAKFDVCLVNARDIKGVKGRPKSDHADCIWISRLHSYGLMRASFVPSGQVSALKSLWECRSKIVDDMARYAQRINNELVKMNFRLDMVVSDTLGESGSRIIEALISGTHDAPALLGLVDTKVKSSKEECLAAFTAHFQKDHLTVLKVWYQCYCDQRHRLHELNEEIYHMLESFPKKASRENLPPEPLNYREDKLEFSYKLRPLFYEILGTDLTQLCGIGPGAVIAFLATVGTDVNSWPTYKHFTSWLTLAPVNQVSAGNRKSGKTKRSNNLLRKALVSSAMTVQRTDSFLGENHRRLKSRIGPSNAKVAIARKLAVILYQILKNNTSTIRYSAEVYLQHRQERELKNLHKKAYHMGYMLTPIL